VPRQSIVDGAKLSSPALAVHGGAGTFERISTENDASAIAKGIAEALSAGWEVLARGGSALSAVVEAVAHMEDSGSFNAGRSGARTIDGRLELDAAVMDGASGNVGGVCATTWPRNPVRAALALSALGGPADGPILLAGEGADRFAEASGLLEMKTGPSTVEGAGQVPVSGVAAQVPDSPAGTVGAVAVDKDGHVAAATSTGGRSGQLHGRVGDSAIPGAGTWADDRTIAVSATGEGESFVVSGFAHSVHWSIAEGADPREALEKALEAVVRRGGDGGAISITPQGEVTFIHNTRGMARGFRNASEVRVMLFDTELPGVV
jgi:L-asparaginase / beta-aspartyl-peptidase